MSEYVLSPAWNLFSEIKETEAFLSCVHLEITEGALQMRGVATLFLLSCG